jgi:CDP-glucose 4,6-dehydratase
MGASVTGISLPPQTQPNLFALTAPNDVVSHFCDIREATSLAGLVRSARPQIVFHLAAQALVRESYRHPLNTWSSNVMGTAHLLDALRDQQDTKVAVMVTTDKVYRNQEWPWPYRESDALGGHDPYSASKAACELVIESYRAAFLSAQDVALASARAGNVIGGGDWSADRLIPDAVRAWQAGQVLSIRRPDAVRPWQHVLEPLAGYLCLAEKLWQEPEVAGPFNLGPLPQEAATVRTVVELARSAFGQGEVQYGDGSEGPHEAGMLALEIAKARAVLGLQPRWTLPEAVGRTMRWYGALRQGADARALCRQDIDDYGASS